MKEHTLKQIKELLKYDPESGIFVWNKDIGRRIKKGIRAGYFVAGQITIKVGEKTYRANRLAWFYMTGSWPEFDIKPVNGIVEDIRWENLKLGTRKR